jgi:hypothetical protein
MPVRAPGRLNCSIAAQSDASTSTWRSSRSASTAFLGTKNPSGYAVHFLINVQPPTSLSTLVNSAPRGASNCSPSRGNSCSPSRNTQLGSHELGPSLLQLRSAANLHQVVRQRLNAAHQCFQIYRMMLPVGIDPKRLCVTDRYRRSDSDHQHCWRRPQSSSAESIFMLSPRTSIGA